MKKTYISIQNHDLTFTNYNSLKNCYSGAVIEKPLAMLLILLLSPVMLINCLLAVLLGRNVIKSKYQVDALGRQVVTGVFAAGIIKRSAVLIDIYKEKIGFCGIPLTHSIPLDSQFSITNQIKIKAGIFSLYDLHIKTGLTVASKEKLLEEQINSSTIGYINLLVKSVLSSIFYGSAATTLKKVKNLSLFGLRIRNTSMQDAVNWVTHHQSHNSSPKLGFFVNVNSINLAVDDINFYNNLSKADGLFADGSGMRLAAKREGFMLQGNNNGTDMLPHLCKRCVKQGLSIYLLGAAPTIAEKAATNLQSKYPGLQIAGTQHGFIKNHDDEIIENINQSKCDVLLVAMGSPIQETWLLNNKDKLTCNTALAVGGLFDFYSGNIKRSPLWMREIGMEWVWRLLQEPKKKFNRYVIGTPLFLYRIIVLGLAHKGVKS